MTLSTHSISQVENQAIDEINDFKRTSSFPKKENKIEQ